MGVNETKVKSSCQHWYGEYRLPNTLYVAPKGYDVIDYAVKNNGLDGQESFWLKDGYIVVNFKIVTVKDGNFDNPILSYSGTTATTGDMWQIEGYQTTKTDSDGKVFNLNEGDIIFYDTNHRSTDDYSSSGTH